MILDLGNKKLTKDNFGAKAYHLSVLMEKGYPVPRGFAISFNAFEEYLKYNENPYIPENYLENNIELQKLILQGDFSEAAIKVLMEKLEYLEPPYVVRSSAFCEDSAEHSMAGLFESIVGIEDFEGVKDAIKKCYASLFSDKALEYFYNNLDMEEKKMAVIVQSYISGTVSGVIFTADTTEMDPEVLCISAVNGECCDFVSGKLASSLYRLGKQTGELLLTHCVNETVKIETPLINTLYALSMNIENLFGGYQDIEWTSKGDDVYILQARPVTTFKQKEFPIRWAKPTDEDLSWRRNFPDPLQRIYWDMAFIEQEAFSSGAETAGSASFNNERTIQNGYVYFTKKPMQDPERKKEIFDERMRAYYMKGMNLFFEEILPELEALTSTLKKYCNRSLTPQGTVDFLNLSVEYVKKSGSSHWPSDACTRYAESFKDYVAELYGEINFKDYRDLLYGKSVATEERELLIRMSEFVKCSPELLELFTSCKYDSIVYRRLHKSSDGSELYHKISEYVNRFGACMSGRNGLEVIAERPECVIGKIRELLNMKMDDFLNTQKDIHANRKRVEESILALLDEAKKEEFQRLLNSARLSYLVTDTHSYYIDRTVWGYWRLAVKSAGEILAQKNIIKVWSDVYFLTMDEVKTALLEDKSFDENIKAAKELYMKQKKLMAPVSIGKQPPKSEKQAAVKKASDDCRVTQLEGVSTFQGEVQGRIILGHPSPNMDKGSILVLYWGHGFDALQYADRIKGIIFQNGSPFDHTGIITRELNIPAVYYVKEAMSILKSGDMVKIDGGTGKIFIL